MGCVGVTGDVTQTVQRDGTSMMDIRYNTGGNLPTDQFKTSYLKTALKQVAADGFTRQEWDQILVGIGSTQFRLDTSDPRLVYPGENPSDQQLEALATVISELFNESMSGEGLCEYFIAQGGGDMIPSSLKNRKCSVEGKYLVITGLFEPENVSKFFEKDEYSFPYVTYRYSPLGSMEIFADNPMFSGFFGQLESLGLPFSLGGMLDMASNGSVNESVKQQVSSTFSTMISQTMGTGMGGVSISYTLRMPGEITNTTVGALENNTVKINLLSLYAEPVSIVESRELNPLLYYLGAVLAIAALVGGFLALKPALVKAPKKKARKKARKTKRRKKK